MADVSNVPNISKDIKFSAVSEFLEKLTTCKQKHPHLKGKDLTKRQDQYSNEFFGSLHNYREEFIKKNGPGVSSWKVFSNCS